MIPIEYFEDVKVVVEGLRWEARGPVPRCRDDSRIVGRSLIVNNEKLGDSEFQVLHCTTGCSESQILVAMKRTPADIGKDTDGKPIKPFRLVLAPPALNQSPTYVPDPVPQPTAVDVLALYDDESILPPEPLIGKLFRRRTVCMVAGPTGSLKTWLSALHVAGCLATGDPVVPAGTASGWATKRSRVLVCSEEMDIGEIRERLLQMFTREQVERMAGWLSFSFGNRFDFAAQPDKSAKRLRELCQGYEAVIVDALSDIHDGEENSNREMGRVLKALRDDVARPVDALVIVVHHAPKWNPEKPLEFVRGASAIKDKVSELLLVSPLKGWKGGPRSKVLFGKTRHGVALEAFTAGLVEGDNGKLQFEFGPVKPEEEDEAQTERQERTRQKKSGDAQEKLGRGFTRLEMAKDYDHEKGVSERALAKAAGLSRSRDPFKQAIRALSEGQKVRSGPRRVASEAMNPVPRQGGPRGSTPPRLPAGGPEWLRMGPSGATGASASDRLKT